MGLGQCRSFAFGTKVQVIAPVLLVIIKPKLPGDRLEVVYMGLGGKFLSGMGTDGHSPTRTFCLVEVGAQLRQALEDVEKLSKRKPYQKQDHGDRVRYGHELISFPLQKGIIIGNAYPCDGDGDKQYQGEPVIFKGLGSNQPTVGESSLHHDHRAYGDQY